MYVYPEAVPRFANGPSRVFFAVVLSVWLITLGLTMSLSGYITQMAKIAIGPGLGWAWACYAAAVLLAQILTGISSRTAKIAVHTNVSFVDRFFHYIMYIMMYSC